MGFHTKFNNLILLWICLFINTFVFRIGAHYFDKLINPPFYNISKEITGIYYLGIIIGSNLSLLIYSNFGEKPNIILGTSCIFTSCILFYRPIYATGYISSLLSGCGTGLFVVATGALVGACSEKLKIRRNVAISYMVMVSGKMVVSILLLQEIGNENQTLVEDENIRYLILCTLTVLMCFGIIISFLITEHDKRTCESGLDTKKYICNCMKKIIQTFSYMKKSSLRIRMLLLTPMFVYVGITLIWIEKNYSNYSIKSSLQLAALSKCAVQFSEFIFAIILSLLSEKTSEIKKSTISAFGFVFHCVAVCFLTLQTPNSLNHYYLPKEYNDVHVLNEDAIVFSTIVIAVLLGSGTAFITIPVFSCVIKYNMSCCASGFSFSMNIVAISAILFMFISIGISFVYQGIMLLFAGVTAIIFFFYVENYVQQKQIDE